MSESVIWAILLMVIGFAVYMLSVEWRIVSKSGEKGWKVLIPVYGSYVYMKAVDSISEFWGMFIVGIISGVLGALISNLNASLIFSVIFGLIEMGISISVCKNIAGCFDKSGGFAAGLFFLSPIFLGILAFGSARHYKQGDEISDSSPEGASSPERTTGRTARILRIIAGAGFIVPFIYDLINMIRYFRYYNWLYIILVGLGLGALAVLAVALIADKKKLSFIAAALSGCVEIVYIIDVVSNWTTGYYPFWYVCRCVFLILFYLFIALAIYTGKKYAGILLVACNIIGVYVIPCIMGWSPITVYNICKSIAAILICVSVFLNEPVKENIKLVDFPE